MIVRYQFVIFVCIIAVICVWFCAERIFNRGAVYTEKVEELKSQVQVSVTDSVFSTTGPNAYKISAKHMTQNDDGTYYLHNISGVYHLQNNQTVDLFADSGSIDSVDDIAAFNDGVKLRYIKYELLTQQLDINFKERAASSPTMVVVRGEDARVVADEFNTTQELNQIAFHGHIQADFVIHNDR
jgi:LPS export ABC transporter protein LptC